MPALSNRYRFNIFILLLLSLQFWIILSQEENKCTTIEHCQKCPDQNKCEVCESGFNLNNEQKCIAAPPAASPQPQQPQPQQNPNPPVGSPQPQQPQPNPNPPAASPQPQPQPPQPSPQQNPPAASPQPQQSPAPQQNPPAGSPQPQQPPAPPQQSPAPQPSPAPQQQNPSPQPSPAPQQNNVIQPDTNNETESKGMGTFGKIIIFLMIAFAIVICLRWLLRKKKLYKSSAYFYDRNGIPEEKAKVVYIQ